MDSQGPTMRVQLTRGGLRCPDSDRMLDRIREEFMRQSCAKFPEFLEPALVRVLLRGIAGFRPHGGTLRHAGGDQDGIRVSDRPHR